MAPITDSPAEMRRPAKIAGSAAREHQLAQPRQCGWRACSVNRSCIPGSADCRPNSVFTMIGKIEMITHTMTRDLMPYPNQKPISGTIARIGIACSVDHVREDRPLGDLGLAHQHGDHDAEHDRDREPDRRRPWSLDHRALEDLVEVVPVEEAVVDDLVRRAQQEPRRSLSMT